jgi:hypothetical protein
MPLAVHDFARTDAAGESDTHTRSAVSRSDWMAHHHRQYEQAAGEDKEALSACAAVVHTIQVTDVGSQTTVGSFSRRTANITTLATVHKELKVEVLSAAKRGQVGVDHVHPTGILHCFTDTRYRN